MEGIDEAAGLLRGAQSLLVLTGAGISAESGVPTYRGPGGLYETNPELPGRLTPDALREDPDAVWRHVDEVRRVVAGAAPNPAHEILAGWERDRLFPRFLLATQNVDGLHQAAGSDRVSELHGSIWQIAVPAPPETEDPEFSGDAAAFLAGGDREGILRKWSERNGAIVREDREVPFPSIPPSREPGARPNVLLFDEGYGSRLLWVEDFIRGGPDAVLVVGCSAGVRILDVLLRRCRAGSPGCAIVNVNPHEDRVEASHLFVRAKASSALLAIDAGLRGP